MTIVVTGGSGFIGSALSRTLLEKGHTVIVIDTDAPTFTHQNLFFIQCDLEKNLLPFNVLERTDAVIHLAGKNIFTRWTPASKEAIKQSRIISTRNIIDSLKQTATRPSIFISASSVGYYGEAGETELDERSQKGNTFLSTLVEEWETEALAAEQTGCRVVLVRTAPVIGKDGFLKPLMQLARYGVVFRLSKKDFWMPWVHIDDIVKIYCFALETSTLQGVVNATAPTPVTHRQFIRTFAKTNHRRVLGAIGMKLLKPLVGELLEELTTSQKVFPRRLLDKGFLFEYTNVDGALRSVSPYARKS